MKRNSIFSLNIMLVLLLILAFVSCDDKNDIEEHNWQIVWQDEFDVDGAPDATKWTYEQGRGPNGDGWGNAELQAYTDKPENIIVENGVLKITALQSGNSFTSARIITKGLYEKAYGKFEAKIKMPYGP